MRVRREEGGEGPRGRGEDPRRGSTGTRGGVRGGVQGQHPGCQGRGGSGKPRGPQIGLLSQSRALGVLCVTTHSKEMEINVFL